jgi:hypothetical protein
MKQYQHHHQQQLLSAAARAVQSKADDIGSSCGEGSASRAACWVGDVA